MVWANSCSRKLDVTNHACSGVVIADDTVVTDIKLQESVMPGNNIKFGLLGEDKHHMGESIVVTKEEVFSSKIASSRLEDNTLFLVLGDKIPKKLLRPICIPPKRYVEKMVKPTSCKGDMMQTITKVTNK